MRLVDIDKLSATVDLTLEQRRKAIPLVEGIIADHRARFDRWYQAQVALPVIASLFQKAEAIRKSEVERLFTRCPDLREREQMLIRGMSLTIFSKLLHPALARIREMALVDSAKALAEAVMIDELFELHVGPPEINADSRL